MAKQLLSFIVVLGLAGSPMAGAETPTIQKQIQKIPGARNSIIQSDPALSAKFQLDRTATELPRLVSQLDEKVTAYVALKRGQAVARGQSFREELRRRLAAAEGSQAVSARPSLSERFLGFFRTSVSKFTVKKDAVPLKSTKVLTDDLQVAAGKPALFMERYSPEALLRADIERLCDSILALMPSHIRSETALAPLTEALMHVLNAKTMLVWAPFGVDLFGNTRDLPSDTAKAVERIGVAFSTAIAGARIADAVNSVSNFYETSIRLSGFDLKNGESAWTAAALDVLKRLSDEGRPQTLIYAFVNAILPQAVAWYDLTSPVLRDPSVRLIFSLRYPNLLAGLDQGVPATIDRSQFLIPKLAEVLGNQFSLDRDNFSLWAFDATRFRVSRVPSNLTDDVWNLIESRILHAELAGDTCTFMQRLAFAKCPEGCVDAGTGSPVGTVGGLPTLDRSAAEAAGVTGLSGPMLPGSGVIGGSGLGGLGGEGGQAPSFFRASPQSDACGSSSDSSGGAAPVGQCLGRPLGGGSGRFLPGNPELDRALNCALSSAKGGFRFDASRSGMPNGGSDFCLAGQTAGEGSGGEGTAGETEEPPLTEEEMEAFDREKQRLAGTVDHLHQGARHHDGASWLAGRIHDVSREFGLTDSEGSPWTREQVEATLRNNMNALSGSNSEISGEFGESDSSYFTETEEGRLIVVFSAETVRAGPGAIREAMVAALIQSTFEALASESGSAMSSRTIASEVGDLMRDIRRQRGSVRQCADDVSCGTACGYLDSRIKSFTQCVTPSAGSPVSDPCRFVQGGTICEDTFGFDDKAFACAPAMNLGALSACSAVLCAADGTVQANLDTSMDATTALNCCRSGGGSPGGGSGGMMDPLCRTASPTADGCMPPQCYSGFVPPECSGGAGGLPGGGPEIPEIPGVTPEF